MIFVTVGTHEQQFNRLISAIDSLAKDGVVQDSIFVQTGYSDYEPTSCAWTKFVPALEMKERMANADVVITHGGPSSFIEAMSVGKAPVVVPRRVEYGEHVNNHQLEFVRLVAERQGGIIPVYEVEALPSAINTARLASEGKTFQSHNSAFCTELCRLINLI